tara:strand:+ start:513 stop:626 length:114 start_codon:yes stop_codon:yes gene_type:complete
VVVMNVLKAGLFYLIAVAILTVYGIEVCLFLDQLEPL